MEDCKLADALLALYLDETHDRLFRSAHLDEDYFKDTVGLVRSHIESYGGRVEHHETVLDHLVTRLYQEGESPHLQRISNFFGALVQGLYELGHNDFLVNLSPLTMCRASGTVYRLGNEFGKHLRGKEGRLLRMECRGDFSDVCKYSRYCAVELKGTAVTIAESADTVVITSLGPTGFAGAAAVECELYVKSQDSVMKNGWYNTFYVRDGVTEEFLRSLEKPMMTAVGEKDFFERGNRVLVPGSAGNWAEVGR